MSADPRRLGRLRPAAQAPRLRLAAYQTAELPALPDRCDRTAGVAWQMFGNDLLGCCTISALANAIVQRTTLAGGVPVVMPDAVVERCYSAVSGYVPGRPDTDAGAVETDVLGWFARNGVALRAQTLECGVWATLDAHDRDAIRHAVHLFGSAYVGLELPLRAQGQAVWDAVAGDAPEDRPGSWGGHAVIVAGYDTEGVSLITWGAVQRASWAFVDRYLDEAYAIWAPGEWLGPSGLSPDHFDFAALARDLRALGR